jgi:VWFA-related protein
MFRSLVATAFAAFFGLSATAQQQPAQPFRAESNLIVVPTVVVDKKGASVTGLSQSDFQLFEDGKPVPIETFVPASVPATAAEGSRFIVLVLDNVTTPPEIAFRLRDVAKRFTKKMGPSDSVAAISLRGGKWSGATTRAAADAAIDKFQPAIGESVRTPAEDAVQGLEAIASLAKQLAPLPHRRKLLVFIGAAEMFSPKEPSAFDDRGPSLTPAWFEAVRATGIANFSVYAIDVRGHQGSSAEDTDSFTSETGGAAWTNTNNYGAAVDRIWQEAASYYLLGYAAPINDHKIHKIEVKVNTPGVTLRARRARG